MKARSLVLLALVALSSLHPARAEAVTSDAINTMMVSAPPRSEVVFNRRLGRRLGERSGSGRRPRRASPCARPSH